MLPGVNRVWRAVDAGVMLHVYAWRERGAPKIGEYAAPSRAEARAMEAADAAGLALRYGEARRRPTDVTTLKGLCDAFERSVAFRGLADSTQAEWSRTLKRIAADLGDLSGAALQAKGARALFLDWRDGYAHVPRKADMGLQVASRLLSWAVEREVLDRNVLLGAEGIYRSDRAEVVWTPGELARLLAHLTPDAARAVRFIVLTGFRRGDAIRAPWSAVNEEKGVIAWRTGKGRRARTVQVAEITPELRALLDECPRRGPTILTTAAGRAWHRDGLGASFHRARKAAGIEDGPEGTSKRLHDLRGTTATERVAKILADPAFRRSMGWEGDAPGAAKGYVDVANVVALTRADRRKRKPDA